MNYAQAHSRIIPPEPPQPTGANRVGEPAGRYLHEFGSQIWLAFGEPPYLVGSACYRRDWKDIDVRLMLDDKVFEQMFGPVERRGTSGKLAAFEMAFSELGKRMTGLPIDFQIQPQSVADKFHGTRNPLGIVELRFRKQE